MRKGGIGERAQHRRHHAAYAIGKNAAFQPGTEGLVIYRLLRDQAVSRQIPHRLKNADQRHQRNRHKNRAVKLKTKRKQLRQAEPDIADAFKLERSAQRRRRAADGNPHHHRREAQPAVFRAAQQDDGPQRARAECDIAHAGKRFRLLAAAPVNDADFNQANADQRNHAAGNHRGKNTLQRFNKAADETGHQRGDEVDAKQHGHNILRRAALPFYPHTAGNGDAEERKAGALHTDHARADPPNAVGLQKGTDAGGQQGHAD